GGDQDGDAGADQLLDDTGQLLGALLGPAVDNRDVAAIGPAERGEILTERVDKAPVVLPRPHLDKADARRVALAEGRVPAHRGAGGEQQQVAPSHSMTSPVRPRRRTIA